jgi:hypothetical protein
LSAEFNAHFSLQSCEKKQPQKLINEKVSIILAFLPKKKKKRFGGFRSSALDGAVERSSARANVLRLLWVSGRMIVCAGMAFHPPQPTV